MNKELAVGSEDTFKFIIVDLKGRGPHVYLGDIIEDTCRTFPDGDKLVLYNYIAGLRALRSTRVTLTGTTLSKHANKVVLATYHHDTCTVEYTMLTGENSPKKAPSKLVFKPILVKANAIDIIYRIKSLLVTTPMLVKLDVVVQGLENLSRAKLTQGTTNDELAKITLNLKGSKYSITNPVTVDPPSLAVLRSLIIQKEEPIQKHVTLPLNSTSETIPPKVDVKDAIAKAEGNWVERLLATEIYEKPIHLDTLCYILGRTEAKVVEIIREVEPLFGVAAPSRQVPRQTFENVLKYLELKSKVN